MSWKTNKGTGKKFQSKGRGITSSHMKKMMQQDIKRIIDSEATVVDKLLKEYHRLGNKISDQPHDKFMKERIKRASIGNRLRNMGFGYLLDIGN